MRPREPEQSHGEINGAKADRSPSWQIRQKTEDELALDAADATVTAEGEVTLGAAGVMGKSPTVESTLDSEELEPE